jgi:hypothetical protein
MAHPYRELVQLSPEEPGSPEESHLVVVAPAAVAWASSTLRLGLAVARDEPMSFNPALALALSVALTAGLIRAGIRAYRSTCMPSSTTRSGGRPK